MRTLFRNEDPRARGVDEDAVLFIDELERIVETELEFPRARFQSLHPQERFLAKRKLHNPLAVESVALELYGESILEAQAPFLIWILRCENRFRLLPFDDLPKRLDRVRESGALAFVRPCRVADGLDRLVGEPDRPIHGAVPQP